MNQPFPSNAVDVVYNVYARKFSDDAPPVLYLFASGFLMNSVSRLFFAHGSGFNWTLMQETPNIIDNLLVCYQAAATTSQPVLDIPATVNITDGYGTHHVQVEPWDSTVVEATPATADYAVGATGKTQLARGNQISYKAFSRPYNAGGTVVLLLASCSYPTGMWHIFFSQSSAGWQLYETVPGFANQLVTYYVAGFSTGGGLLEDPSTVPIEDGYGVHQVPVQPINVVTQAAGIAAATEPRIEI